MQTRRLEFDGKGGEIFGIRFVNIILTVLTLGIYAAWAKAKTISYFYRTTRLEGTPFTYHGTGKQIFIGYLKLIVVFIVLYGVYMVAIFLQSIPLMVIGVLILIIGLTLLIPLMIHGAMRFRLSRTSWRGIHMGYRGSKTELFKLYLKGTLLTLVTLGIYGSWFTMKVNRYLYGNVRLGDVRLEFEGSGKEYFFINLKGLLLTIVTLGVYGFWYYRNVFNYTYSCFRAYQGEKRIDFVATLTVGSLFKTTLLNLVTVIPTLGLASPWATARFLRLILGSIELVGDFDGDAITQTEENYAVATGTGFLDAIELDIGDGIW